MLIRDFNPTSVLERRRASFAYKNIEIGEFPEVGVSGLRFDTRLVSRLPL